VINNRWPDPLHGCLLLNFVCDGFLARDFKADQVAVWVYMQITSVYRSIHEFQAN